MLSSSKEGGGLLASIGLKKEDVKADESQEEDRSEEDPHKKSDLFDTSKDRIKAQALKVGGAMESDEDDFDLGFAKGEGSDAAAPNKSGAENKFGDARAAADDMEMAAGMSDDEDESGMTREQAKAIDEEFKRIYEKDPELRKALAKSDVAQFSVIEKYQIIEAYMQGGAAGLQIELEDEDEDEKALL